MMMIVGWCPYCGPGTSGRTTARGFSHEPVPPYRSLVRVRAVRLSRALLNLAELVVGSPSMSRIISRVSFTLQADLAGSSTRVPLPQDRVARPS
jgi:hypothetical protein